MRNGFNLLGIDPNWQYMATGAVIVVAVELDVVRGRLEFAVPEPASGGCRMTAIDARCSKYVMPPSASARSRR